MIVGLGPGGGSPWVRQCSEDRIWVASTHLALVDASRIKLKPLETPGKSKSLWPRNLENLDFIQLPVVSKGLQAGERKWYKVKVGRLTNSHKVISTRSKPTNDLVLYLAGFLIFLQGS